MTIDLPSSRPAIARMATEYARRELTPVEARAFDHCFRTSLEFRRIAAVKLLGSDPSPEDEVAFAAAHPHVGQFDLRRRRWRDSPFRDVFATLDAGTMRMPGDADRSLDEHELRARKKSMRDDRHYWASGRSYDFTYEELRGDDAAFATVRDAIRDGADYYFFGELSQAEATCFEQWYIRSCGFRKFVIPYLATAERRVDAPGYDWSSERGESRWAGRGTTAVRQFKFEVSTAKELVAAERMSGPALARLGLPAVDVRTGELLPDSCEWRLAAA